MATLSFDNWSTDDAVVCTSTGADRWNYLSKYDTSSKLGTNTPWGLLLVTVVAWQYELESGVAILWIWVSKSDTPDHIAIFAKHPFEALCNNVTINNI